MKKTKEYNLWILTEERPKKEVIKQIISKICKDTGFKYKIDDIKFTPVFKDCRFAFIYLVEGIVINGFEKILIKTVSGSSSFLDFLIYFSNDTPNPKDEPEYAIEETKTSDIESRNTGVYQRCSKFVYVNFHYPNCKKIMLYNIRVKDSHSPTKTNIFGTRMLITLGVEILGKTLDPEVFKKFESIDELIDFKNNMRGAPTGNVPILINKFKDRITVSGRLYKTGGLKHDPNTGALTIISQTLRKLGWKEDIVITQHGLSQANVGRNNKFIKIATEIGIKLDGIAIPKSTLPTEYWHYEQVSEKIATIFLHLISEQIENVRVIYENHAGCERGYFFTKEGTPITIHKYIKNSKKNGIIKIPDLIIREDNEKEIFNLEGKRYDTRQKGIKEIERFDPIEEEYIQKYYPDYKITRGVVIYGGSSSAVNDKILFQIDLSGNIYISQNAPQFLKQAINRINP